MNGRRVLPQSDRQRESRLDPGHLLAGAQSARSQPLESAAAIARALVAAPQDVDVRLAAYRFYFFTHDYARALDQAQVLLGFAARRLNLPPDWRLVSPEDAAFTAHDFAPGLYLQVLIAMGYCLARLGQVDPACEVLAQAARLDPSDRFGGAWLRDNILRAALPDED